MKRRFLRSVLRILVGSAVMLALVVSGVWLVIAQPSFRSNARSEVTVDPERLEEHVLALSRDFHPRSHLNVENLSVKVAMQGTTELSVYSINGPTALPGLDFSDHRNYWPHAINAVMVTDTAFYRNKAYHSAEDTSDRLDYEAMARVAVAVYEAARTVGR